MCLSPGGDGEPENHGGRGSGAGRGEPSIERNGWAWDGKGEWAGQCMARAGERSSGSLVAVWVDELGNAGTGDAEYRHAVFGSPDHRHARIESMFVFSPVLHIHGRN